MKTVVPACAIAEYSVQRGHDPRQRVATTQWIATTRNVHRLCQAHEMLEGTLIDWWALEKDYADAALLLGNGFSVAASPKFSYGSLFEVARKHGLLEEQSRLFETLETQNFETVLHALQHASRINSALGVEDEITGDAYAEVRRVLQAAVTLGHAPWNDLSDKALKRVFECVSGHGAIFSLSYDLVLYWALAANGFEPTIDFFNASAPFDAKWARKWVTEDRTPVYYLHGGLHLRLGGDGSVSKRNRGPAQSLLDQAWEEEPADPEAQPLLVTEGSADGKRAHIAGNEYLDFASERLRDWDKPLVVFGCALGTQDDHIAAMIQQHPRRAVAFSLRQHSESQVVKRKKEILAQLALCQRVEFFNAATHPLSVAFSS